MASLILRCELCFTEVPGKEANDHLRSHQYGFYGAFTIESSIHNVRELYLCALLAEYNAKYSALKEILMKNDWSTDILPTLELKHSDKCTSYKIISGILGYNNRFKRF